MIKLNCPVCDAKMELLKTTKLGGRVTCPNCFAQLVFKKDGKTPALKCSLCPEGHSVCSEDCERRISHLKQTDLLP